MCCSLCFVVNEFNFSGDTRRTANSVLIRFLLDAHRRLERLCTVLCQLRMLHIVERDLKIINGDGISIWKIWSWRIWRYRLRICVGRLNKTAKSVFRTAGMSPWSKQVSPNYTYSVMRQIAYSLCPSSTLVIWLGGPQSIFRHSLHRGDKWILYVAVM
jgi:hypothetical protein